MVKIAVMGDAESIRGFAAVGLEIFPCDGTTDEVHLFRRLAAGDYGIIYVTDDLAQRLDKEIRKTEEQMLPAVIPIPGARGNTGLGMQRLKASVEKAVGSDILFNND